MITDLVIDHYCLDDDIANPLQDLCEACGKGLQKTNIVKDFADDLSRGVCYLPDEWMQETMYSPLTLSGAPLNWKQNVLNDVMNELLDFFSYIQALPYQAKGYRLASLLCALPACQTILKAAGNQDKLFTPEHDIKISRVTFYKCIHDASRCKSLDLRIYPHKNTRFLTIHSLLFYHCTRIISFKVIYRS